MPGLNAFYRRVAEEFARRLVERFDGAIEAVVLYGSVARKRARRDSDIDVLVIAEAELDEQVGDLGYDLDLETNFDAFLMPVTFTGERVGDLLHLGSPFMRHIIEEGIPLYDRGTFGRICREVLGTGKAVSR